MLVFNCGIEVVTGFLFVAIGLCLLFSCQASSDVLLAVCMTPFQIHDFSNTYTACIRVLSTAVHFHSGAPCSAVLTHVAVPPLHFKPFKTNNHRSDGIVLVCSYA